MINISIPSIIFTGSIPSVKGKKHGPLPLEVSQHLETLGPCLETCFGQSGLLPNIQCSDTMCTSQICLLICFENSHLRSSGKVPKKGLDAFFSQSLAPEGPPASRNSWSMLENLFLAIRAAPQLTMTKYEAGFSIMPSYLL